MTGEAEGTVWAVTATYNEAENLPQLAERMRALGMNADGPLAKAPTLVIVDDNSPDGTGEIADRLAAENPEAFAVLHRPAKMGYASAHRLGIGYALDHGAGTIITMDADLSHDPERIPALLAKLEEADVVVGSRYVEGGGTVNWGTDRKIISRTAGALVRLASGMNVADPTGGFRAYRAELLRAAKFRQVPQEGYAFLSEMLFRCVRAGGTVAEVPITFVDRRFGRSKLSRRIIFEAIGHLFTLAWRRITRWRP
ncbi:MAG: polyprenol monophosphomannose synthase [Armatimonadota bacterium]|jgi:dolichol-phosphate mannosyltransferase